MAQFQGEQPIGKRGMKDLTTLLIGCKGRDSWGISAQRE